MKRMLKRLIMLAAVVVAGQVALAAPAHAGVTSCVYWPPNGCNVGNGTWTSSGDKMEVCDWLADGKSVVVLAWINGVRQANKWRTSGAGDCTPRSYGDVAENLEIKFYACLGDYSDNILWPATCGPTITSRT